MESVAITALICGTIGLLGRWILGEARKQRFAKGAFRLQLLEVVRGEWREALPVILAELDFSFKPTLTIEIKQGVSTGVEAIYQTLETLPMNIQAYISKDSADFAREDLVKRAFVYRDGGKREWEEVLELLEQSVKSAW